MRIIISERGCFLMSIRPMGLMLGMQLSYAKKRIVM